jgi:folate-binding protein YgfZ
MPHPKPILTDLSYKGLIRASGADAVAFLQGQLSTDVEKLTATTTQLTSWNTAKGRVVTLIRLFRRGEDIYLAMPAGLKALVLKRLSMYVLRSKVTLTDAGSELGCLGLTGEDASTLLAQADIPVPARINDVTTLETLQVLRLYGDDVPRYVLYGPEDKLAALKRRWVSATIPGTEDDWALRRILIGEPTVHPETSEHFVAQMLDLDKFEGIDFKKGCYIGQEIIARAHYRSGVKRHLVRAESSTASRIKPGTDLHAKGQDSPVAEVADARLDSQGLWQMLIVIQDDFREADLVHTDSGAAVKLVS